MAGNWPIMKLGEFVTLQRGHDLPDERRVAGEVPVIGSFGVTGWHNEARTRGPGVTVGRSGASFGVVSYSPIDFWPLNTALYVIDFHGNDPKFSYYFLQTFDFAKFNSGSAQPSLNRNFIHPVEVCVPPPTEQVVIAGLLGTLDDKIELNRRMAETLEAMTRALFKSWFVDFDPVRAKAQGHATVLPDELAALFPDSLDENGVPEGWRSSAGAIGELVRSMVNPADVEPTIPYIGLEHLERRNLLVGRWGSAQDVGSAKATFQVRDLLFGKLRPYFHKVAVAPSEGICSSDIFVFRPRSGVPRSFLYMSFSQADFVESASKASSGTRMPRADWSYMRQLPAILPPSELLAVFDSIIAPQIDAMMAKAGQSRTLSELRDTLLPKLISGELRIAEAEERIAAA